MRVTNNMLSDSTLRNLNQIMARLSRLQGQLSSGKRISKPSDDPIAVSRALQYRADISGIERYLSNADAAKAWLNASDIALDGVSQVISRARELAVQGANSNLSGQDRTAIAVEVGELITEAVNLGNSAFGDRYIFAGHKTTSPPMTLQNGVLQYNGDQGEIQYEVGVGTTMTINVTGDTVFTDVLNALTSLRNGLAANSSSAVDSSIGALDGALDTVLSQRARIGAKINRADIAANQLADLKLSVQNLLSRTEDLDMAEAIVNYTAQEAVYNAALAVGARSIQPSLVAFLS